MRILPLQERDQVVGRHRQEQVEVVGRGAVGSVVARRRRRADDRLGLTAEVVVVVVAVVSIMTS